jgi:hypothetical protein
MNEVQIIDKKNVVSSGCRHTSKFVNIEVFS